MRKVLVAAGIYHLMFATWVISCPCQWFDWIHMAHPNHPMMWQGVGAVMGVFGVGLFIASRNPIGHWFIVAVGLMKFSLGIAGFGLALWRQEIPLTSAWIMVVDDLIWWLPFAAILYATLRAHCGVPPTRNTPYSIEEAAAGYTLSDGTTLAQASENKLLALVFLRHFGCTFTRQILRELEGIQREAGEHGAELVLVHMLQDGKETKFLGGRSGIRRIADPRCELYRAFGLGKGGFLELFGPQVWWRGAVALFKGCGVGHLAGDGLQMPGAFLFRDGKIVASQRARSAADLPDLPGLFRGLPSSPGRDTVRA
jgi:hypothetical protein